MAKKKKQRNRNRRKGKKKRPSQQQNHDLGQRKPLHRGNANPSHEPLCGHEVDQEPKLAPIKRNLSTMELTSYILGACAAITGILIGVFNSGGHRDLAIWASFATIVLIEAGAFCWYQNWVWAQDRQSSHNASNEVAIAMATNRAYLSAMPDIEEFQVGKPIDWAVRYRNDGNVPAQILEKSIGITTLSADMELSELGNKEIERINSLPAKWTLTKNEELRFVDEQPPLMTRELLDSLADGTMKLYAISKIWYRDGISDDLRTIIACFEWHVESGTLRLNDKLSYRD